MPSSLTTLLPPASGSSPHPPVSVYGTGPHGAIAAFLDRKGPRLRYYDFAPHHAFVFHGADLPTPKLLRLHRACHPRLRFPSRVPAVLSMRGAGIFTCCPSDTHFCLSLGPDSPRDPGQISFTLETLDIRPEGFPPSSRYSFRHSLSLKVHAPFR